MLYLTTSTFCTPATTYDQPIMSGASGGTNLVVCGWYPTPIQAARVARPPDSLPLPNSASREFPECAFVWEQASENELELGILRSFQWDQLVVEGMAETFRDHLPKPYGGKFTTPLEPDFNITKKDEVSDL